MPGETNLDREERFWSRVILHKSDQCWRWVGHIDHRGYGKFSVGRNRSVPAHRFSYMLEHGPIPAGLVVRHRCDNPGCVNPRHLQVGTHRDNAMDAKERGRMAYGEWAGQAKLTNRQAIEIYERAKTESVADLAREFDVSHTVIWKIKRGETWQRVIARATSQLQEQPA